VSGHEIRVEVVAAARAVVDARDKYDGQDLLETTDPEIERLRRALAALIEHEARLP
jgi:predicted nucleotidyltransferase component of viral defense system